MPTLHQVIPMFETLVSHWEAKAEDPEYSIFHDALQVALSKLTKYYKKLDNSDFTMYMFLMLSLHASPLSLPDELTVLMHSHFSCTSILQTSIHQVAMGRQGRISR